MEYYHQTECTKSNDEGGWFPRHYFLKVNYLLNLFNSLFGDLLTAYPLYKYILYIVFSVVYSPLKAMYKKFLRWRTTVYFFIIWGLCFFKLADISE